MWRLVKSEAYSNLPNYDLIFLTPQIFEQSGFVEPYPKRWIVQEVRLLFDVVVLDEQRGRLDAKFAVPPSPLGLDYLRIEIERIEAFAYVLETD
jgi:hypothetical protein